MQLIASNRKIIHKKYFHFTFESALIVTLAAIVLQHTLSSKNPF